MEQRMKKNEVFLLVFFFFIRMFACHRLSFYSHKIRVYKYVNVSMCAIFLNSMAEILNVVAVSLCIFWCYNLLLQWYESVNTISIGVVFLCGPNTEYSLLGWCCAFFFSLPFSGCFWFDKTTSDIRLNGRLYTVWQTKRTTTAMWPKKKPTSNDNWAAVY